MTIKKAMNEPHIKKSVNEDRHWEAWCGEIIWSHMWAFQSIDHAILSEEKQSTVGVPCPACLRVASERLEKIRQ